MGTLAAVAWEGAPSSCTSCAARGVAVRRGAGASELSERFGPQLTVQAVAAAREGDYDPADLADAAGGRRRPDGGGSAQPDRHGAQPAPAPAARQPVRRGSRGLGCGSAPPQRRSTTTRHTGTGCSAHAPVGQAVSAVSGAFPGIDRDVAVAGALIHDIGKVEAYCADPDAIDLTDEGRLQGEMPLGYYLVRSTIERLGRVFRRRSSRALLHSSSHTTGCSRTAVPWLPGHPRGDAGPHDRQPRGAAWAASTGSRRASRTGRRGRATTAPSTDRRTSHRRRDAAGR